MAEVIQVSNAVEGLKLLNLFVEELDFNSGKAAKNIKKTNDSLKEVNKSTVRKTPNTPKVDGIGKTSKQAIAESDKLFENIQQVDKSLEKLKDTSSIKSLGDRFKEAWDNLSWKEILTASILGVIGPPGSGTSALIQGAMTPEEVKSQEYLNEEEISIFTPQPSGTTNAQSIAPMKSATSGTLAADLPEGSWTAFFDKIAKVFDEALKAVIKGFDVALAKLVTGEGRRLAQVFAT